MRIVEKIIYGLILFGVAAVLGGYLLADWLET